MWNAWYDMVDLRKSTHVKTTLADGLPSRGKEQYKP